MPHFRKAKIREKYVSLQRAKDVLMLSDSQLHQYIINGQLLTAVIYHKPSDYRETREVKLNNGTISTHTKTNSTAFRFVSDDYQYHEFMYLHPEDAGRVLLNKVANREILVSRLFRGPELEPNNGLGLPGESAIAIEPEELILPSEELSRFSKAARITLKKGSEKVLDIPVRPWYDRPIGRTILAVVGIVLAGLILMRVKGEL